MNPATYTAIGAVIGAFLTAAGTIAVAYFQRRDARGTERRRLAMEMHASLYKQVFTHARSVQEAFHNLLEIEGRRRDLHDRFVEMLLEVVRSECRQYCTAIDWRRSPETIYMDMEVEAIALRARALMLDWIARPRASDRIVTHLVENGIARTVSTAELTSLSPTTYAHLTTGTRRIIEITEKDRRQAGRIDKTLQRLIRELKKLTA